MSVADRQARDLPLDAHLHTDLSPDSDVPIDVYARQAVERGIPEIAITDHVDFEPTAPAYDFAPFAVRERATPCGMRARWADRGLPSSLGIEVTYESTASRHPRAPGPMSLRLRDQVGPRHAYSPYVDDRVAGWVAGAPFDEIVAPTSPRWRPRSGRLFDTIGHLDYVKSTWWTTAAVGVRRPDDGRPLLRALVETGMGLEVNASLRQGPRDLPAPWAVARFRSSGARSSRPAPTPTRPRTSPSAWRARAGSPRAGVRGAGDPTGPGARAADRGIRTASRATGGGGGRRQCAEAGAAVTPP
jgi:histidinol phosphatase-like PHP family hydrolase